jgi:hypothetical protein
MASLPAKFNENLPSGSKVINGGHTQTGRHTDDLINLLSFLETRLIKLNKFLFTLSLINYRH